ncbi:MAG: alpha/beta hydrolase-fold protein [Saprospiraceae bacterium]
MLYRNLFFTLCFIVQTVLLSAQLTIRITQVPAITPSDATLYAAGDLNGWEPEDAAFAFTKKTDSTYEIVLDLEPGAIKFKVTRGGWATVEGSEQGTFRPDRELVYNGGDQLEEITIEGWEDLSNGGGTGGENSTAAANVTTIEDFAMPQFETTRRIWLYLPPDYASSNKQYPVIYMHDAQNLFDRNTSFAGEWEVDESLNALFENGDEGAIVVGIENGGANRINELTSWTNAQYGGGQGAIYADFVVNNLKPYIDANYRTRPEREFTAVAGSSLGGLMSLYMAIEHQNVFSKAGVFSPSFWWSNQVYEHVRNKGKQADMRIYFVAGEQESQDMIPDMRSMYNVLLGEGFEEEELLFKSDSDGQHSEWYWAREFPAAYEWLFAGLPTSITDTESGQWIKISPNPASDKIYVELEEELENGAVRIYSLEGKLIDERPLESGNTLNINNLANGMYLMLVTENCMPIANQKLVVEK